MEYSVVWGVAENAADPESFLLEWRAPKLTVLGKRGGAILFSKSGLYRWQTITGKGYGLKDCDEAYNPKDEPDPNNRTVIETEGAVAKRLDAPGVVKIHEPPTFENMSSYANTVRLEASLGSYLFTTEFEDISSCLGAHPSTSHYEPVFDLDTKEFVKIYPTKTDADLLRIEARQLPKAELEPCLQAVSDAQGAREPAQREPPVFEALSLYTATPKWSKERGLHFELYLGAMETYVAGEKTCLLLVKHPPPSLETFPLPGAFEALPKKLAGWNPKGWAIIPVDDEAGLEAAKRVFGVKKKKTEPGP